jgi:hypothetical protein
MLSSYHYCKVYRKSTIKYLRQRTTDNQHRPKTLMNGLLGVFSLKDFDAFFNNYKSNNNLASEALTVLEHFLPSLNEFFDLCEDLEDAKNSKISWYSYTNAASSGDYIRAKSMHYNEALFSDVAINMSEEESEDYNTDEGACFGKVHILSFNDHSNIIF